RLPQRRDRAVGVKIYVDDILVLLGRVLGVLDRAVRAAAEPVGMLLEPGMVGRALDGEVERDLEFMFARRCDQAAEILETAQRRMDGVVSTVRAADRVDTADVVGSGGQAVVASF